MKRSTDRILTTHCGSLPRPKQLLDLMKARAAGEPIDPDTYNRQVQQAVTQTVRQQVDHGINVVSDGEQSKPGFFIYVDERLDGYQPRPDSSLGLFEAEVREFPEYYQEYFNTYRRGTVMPLVPLVCTGPVSYKGQQALQRDIETLKTALAAVQPEEVFMPAIAPSGVGSNEYYPSEEAYFHAVAEAMRTEYQAIVDAGFLLQIDDPFLTDVYSYSTGSEVEKRKRAEIYVEAVNEGIRGIPPDKVRFHTCYGINHGPRVHDAPLQDLVDVMLKVNAGAYSFEAANPRHEHEYHVWEHVKLPEGKALIPGVITHGDSTVEHPDLIAERILRYAHIVGRENVLAGADCGFSSQATYHPEIHPKIMWLKFQAMAEGASRASEQLWRR